ncbi:PREDICTED: uncharacterized protein LOC106749372 isoform X2 [Dinoponera quadriceps]|uniref:Uncharacterized protein LOC106749372 isoform X2 n=1 Tax=Dinoponera quadriceps TaxID=609295 RepID=A0A6P3Y272_DINQU|nr:PREDICTED: uncharacterized protein LOC106749372 isoform X2 [Dinoponera quadriceps]
MLTSESYNNTRKTVEVEVIKTIQKQGYNLNTVNSYGENLLHVSAANGCYEITKTILDREKSRRAVDRKNKFGWTPLMQAIRNGDIDTVKLLLEKKSNVDESTYLGMSVLGLAAAISRRMFETVYDACPTALANTANDDISPLCVAAMKNDKELFFKLLELGASLSDANEYTHIMMRNSTVPEIARLAREHLITEDYWNDTSDNIRMMSEQYGDETAAIRKNGKEKSPKSHVLFAETRSLASPALTYNCSGVFAPSPIACFTKIDLEERSNAPSEDERANHEAVATDGFKTNARRQESPPVTLRRLQSVRPADLEMVNHSDDLDVTLGFTPEFSPLRSPYVPPDINDENVFGENTPTPPRCKTPPKGTLLNSRQAKMTVVLRRSGLARHIPVFLEQERSVSSTRRTDVHCWRR